MSKNTKLKVYGKNSRLKRFGRTAGKFFNTAKKGYGMIRNLLPSKYRQTGDKIIYTLDKLTNNSFYHGLSGEKTPLPLFGGKTTVDAPGDVTKTNYRYVRDGNPIDKAILRNGQRGTYLCKSRYSISSTIGRQSTYDMTAGLTPNNLTYGTCAVFPGASEDDSANVFFPGIYQILGSQIAGTDMSNTGIANTLGTSRIYVNKCSVETQISNTTNAPIVIRLYEVIAKNDLAAMTMTAGNALSGTNIYSPYQYWLKGLANELPSAASTPNTSYTKTTPAIYGTSPRGSQLFNCYWEILASHEITIAMGSSHIHMSTYDVNQYMDGQREVYSSILGGRTRNIMLTIHGIVSASTATDNAGADLSNAGAVVYHSIKYSYAAIPYNRRFSGYTDGGTTVAGTSAYDQDGDVNQTTILQ